MSDQHILCPVSYEQVDGKTVRIIALFVMFSILIFLWNQSILIPICLMIDFGLRAFGFPKFSPLKKVAEFVKNSLNKSSYKVDAAPKKFAAAIGFAFSLAITLLLLFKLSILSIILGCILLFCVLLEGIFGICLGCYVYDILMRIRGVNEMKNE